MRESPDDQRCFVISPIGEPRTPKREKADAVLAFIERVAEDVSDGRKRGLRPHRGEQSFLTGDIMRRIILDILGDALIVSVMFEDNPNVYLELGVAETLGRPVILLMEEDYQVPFDLKLFRCIRYSPAIYGGGDDPEAYAQFKGALTTFLDASETAPVCKAPFDLADTLSPPARTYPLDRFSYFGYEAWSQMLLDSDREVWIAGTTLFELFKAAKPSFFLPELGADREPTGKLLGKKHIFELLRILYLRGRTINILTMHEESPHLEAMMGESDPDDREDMLSDTRHEIHRAHKRLSRFMSRLGAIRFEELVRPGGTLNVVKVYGRPLTHRASLTEKMGIVTPIFYARTDINSGPSFRVTPKSRFEAEQQGGHRWGSFCLYDEVRNDLLLHLAENPPQSVTSEFRKAV